jgi:hypothetical protein
MKSMHAMVLSLALTCAASAQQCSGGSAYLSKSIAMIGGQLTATWEEPGSPWGPTGLLISDGLGPTTVTGFGAICLDANSPVFSLAYFGYLDGNGRATVSASIPPYVDLAALPPTFLLAAVLSPSGVVFSNTERLEFENPNSHKASENPMSGARVFHSAVAMHLTDTSPERRVLISGGGPGVGAFSGLDCYLNASATNSTDIFDPLTRSFSVGPTMSTPRVHHQSVLLADGRVLICGGKDSLGVVTNSCEIFDPVNDSLSPVQGMLEARAGHIATRLNDGRVLVSGGLGTFVGCNIAFNAQSAPCYATTRSSGEIFDPVTGTWSWAVNTMLNSRILHTHTLLLDGRVLIVAGLSWESIPSLPTGGISTVLSECEIFDPTTNSFTPAGSLPSILFLLHGERYAHQAELLPGGYVFVTGGALGTGYNAWNQVYVPSGNYWVPTGALEGVNEIGRGFHRQATLPNGRTMVVGGIREQVLPNPTSTVLDLATSGPQFFRAPIGTNIGIPGAAAVPVFGHSLTLLYDGSFLITGGLSGILMAPIPIPFTAVDQAWVYIP